MVQPSEVVAKVTPPEPDPPELVSWTVVPTSTVVDVLDTVSALGVEKVKVNVTAALDSSLYATPPTSDAALVAMTSQVPASARVKLVSAIVQPSEDVAKVTSPVPDPPELVSWTAVPTSAVVVVFDTVSALGADGSVKVNVTAALVSSSYVTPSTSDAALVAVTSQVPASALVRLVLVMVHPSDVVAKVTSPVPVPPEVVRVTVVPMAADLVELEIVNVSDASAKALWETERPTRVTRTIRKARFIRFPFASRCPG